MQDAQTQDVASTADQYLTFLLGDEEYGVEILNVQEIKSWGPCTPLPRAPRHLLGVINLRGAIVPIIDLRRRFGLDDATYDSTTAIIIVRSEEEDQVRIVGLVVDRVSEVYHLDRATIQDNADVAGTVQGNFIRGLGQIEDKMIILLDLGPVVGSSLDGVTVPEAA